MNIIIRHSNLVDASEKLNEKRIQFLNSKRNITMDGEFTKILFVTEHFSMDSLFIEFPIELQNEPINKNAVLKSSLINHTLTHKFSELEKQLINYYKSYKKVNKKSVLLLSNNLTNNNVKIFTPLKLYSTTNETRDGNFPKTYGIKISGIWESYDSIGLTYKIIEVIKETQP
jgi:hypothetical protein